jgi:TolB-like protein/Flp pilus assembly protein TadD
VNPRNFFAELKRRNVYKVAIAYAVVAWLLMQVASQIFPFFEIPNWAVRLVVLLLVIGFPVALIIAWAFELTPEGIKRADAIEPARSKGRAWIYIAVIAAALSIGLFFLGRFTASNKQGTPTEAPAKSIAVLPFENLSRDPDNAYFTEGIQDEILTKLATVRDLKVISRTSTAKYRSNPDDLKKVANELGVATIVEGAVQKIGDQVRVNVQLIDARIDTHLWAKSYDRQLKDVFAVESEVAQEISDALRAQLSPSEANAVAAAATHDTEAYDLFLKGEHDERQAESTLAPEKFDSAASLYRRALDRDSNFALAYARLGYSRLYRHWFIEPLTPAQLAETKSIIDRAVVLSPGSSDSHLALGVFHYWGHRDYDPALRELDRAIELQPNNSNAMGYRAAIYRRQGDWERSMAEYNRAVELNPRDPSIPGNMAASYGSLRRWSDSEREVRKALALDPKGTAAARLLATTCINSNGDIGCARQAFAGVVADTTRTNPTSTWGTVAAMIDERVYLDVIDRHFSVSLKAWEQPATDNSKEHWRQLAARTAIRVIAGESPIAQSECEAAQTLLEARLAERPDDLRTMTALAWIYISLNRNEDARRLSRHATELLPIAKDALSGPNLLAGLAEVEAHTSQPEEAVKILRQLLGIPAGQVVSIARLRIDPVWDPLRDRAEFQQLLSGPEQVGPNK